MRQRQLLQRHRVRRLRKHPGALRVELRNVLGHNAGLPQRELYMQHNDTEYHQRLVRQRQLLRWHVVRRLRKHPGALRVELRNVFGHQAGLPQRELYMQHNDTEYHQRLVRQRKVL